MKMTKRILAGLLATVSVLTLVACSDKDTSSAAPVVDLDPNQKLIVSGAADKLAQKDLANKEITWMAHYDINPTDGQVEPADLFLFKEKYGGTVKWRQTTWDKRYTDLTTAVLGNEAPDFFPADDMDTFPKGAIKGMFQPVDPYIDLDSDLWADVKEVGANFKYGDGQYVAVIDLVATNVAIYNRVVMEDEGYDDPAELFAEGKWDWDVFKDMCISFVNPDEDKYALDGWAFENAIMQSVGTPLVGMKDGKIVNNLNDPQIEKVQNFMYELQKNNVIYPRHLINNWNIRGDGGVGIGSGLTLFWPSGLWELQNTVEKTKNFGDIEAGEVMFVPMPKDPDSDIHYQSARVNGYNIVKGATNPDGVGAFLDCKKVAAGDAGIKQIATDQLKNEYKWTDEMIEMLDTVNLMAKENPVIEFHQGISEELSTMFDQLSRGTMIPAEQTWTEIRAANLEGVQYRIDEMNAGI